MRPGGGLNLLRTMFVANKAGRSGGAIFAGGSPADPVVLVNALIVRNQAASADRPGGRAADQRHARRQHGWPRYGRSFCAERRPGAGFAQEYAGQQQWTELRRRGNCTGTRRRGQQSEAYFERALDTARG